jgi:hypothetical protein
MIFKSKMKIFYFIVFLSFISYSQEKIISGKVIGQDLIAIPNIKIMTTGSEELAVTDFDGKFEFKCSPDLKKVKFVGLSIQEEEVEISNICLSFEIIILNSWIYDFISLKKANRKVKRERKKMFWKLFTEAYEKKIFTNEINCRIKFENNKYCW